jgi:hypothetical protein
MPLGKFIPAGPAFTAAAPREARKKSDFTGKSFPLSVPQK